MASNPSTPQGGCLTLNFIEGDVDSLSPHTLPGHFRGRAIGKCLFESLTRFGLKGSYELAGAEKISISPCQTHYLFTLRSMHYCDGSIVSASDYEHSWKKALSPESCCPCPEIFYCIKNAQKAKQGKASLSEVGIKALNKTTLLVALERPTSYFLSAVSSCLFAPYKQKGGKLLFNGPFCVESWEKKERLALIANPFFKNRSKTAVQRIHILMVKNQQKAIELYKNRRLDWIGDPFCPLPEDLLATHFPSMAWLKKRVIRPFWLYLNTQTPPLSSPLIRRALSCVIDRRAIIRQFYPRCQPLFTVIPNPLSSYQSSKCSRCDLKKGVSLFHKGLAELGYSRDTIPPLELSCSPMHRSLELARYLKTTWETTFSISVKIDLQKIDHFVSSLQQGKYQIGGCFVSIDYEDPLTLLTKLAQQENGSRWRHTHYRNIVACIQREKKPQMRYSLVQAAETILEREMPVIGLLNQSLNYQHPKHLRDIVFDYMGTPDFRWASVCNSQKDFH